MWERFRRPKELIHLHYFQSVNIFVIICHFHFLLFFFQFFKLILKERSEFVLWQRKYLLWKNKLLKSDIATQYHKFLEQIKDYKENTFIQGCESWQNSDKENFQSFLPLQNIPVTSNSPPNPLTYPLRKINSSS